MIPADRAIVFLLALLACLAVLGTVLLFLRVRHGTRASRAEENQQSTETPLEGFAVHRQVIVEQLQSIDQANRKQLRALMAVMVDSGDWQELGQQFVALNEQRVEHLRALAQRHDSMLSAEKAVFHTLEAYRLSLLIFALYDELVAKSDVVRELLDDWFRSQRGTSLEEFNMRLNLDCVRILLLDLDYAHPSTAAARTQLDLAGEHCAFVAASGQENASPCETLRAEITLRKERLST